MEVTITQFRRDLFRLVDQAMEGETLYVTHRNRRFRIVPDESAKPGLGMLTPLQIVNPESSDIDEAGWKEQMRQGWEEDWSEL